MSILDFARKVGAYVRADGANESETRIATQNRSKPLIRQTTQSETERSSPPQNLLLQANTSEPEIVSRRSQLRLKCSVIKTEARKAFETAKRALQKNYLESEHLSDCSHTRKEQHGPCLTSLPALPGPDSSMLEEVISAGQSSSSGQIAQPQEQRPSPDSSRIVALNPTIGVVFEASPLGQTYATTSAGYLNFGDFQDKQQDGLNSLTFVNDMDDGDLGEEDRIAADGGEDDDIISKEGDCISVGESSVVTDEDDSMVLFRPVMRSVNLQQLAQIALLVRTCIEHGSNLKLTNLPTFSCEVSDDPLCGAYNLAYIVRFSDGVRWIARVPGHGTLNRFGPLDAQKMDNEYHTMEYIRQQTTIPIPTVYHWETTCARVGAPFALMEYVRGQDLADVWHEEFTEQQRLNHLSDLASYMSQLQTLSFGGIGSLYFDENGGVEGIGPRTFLIEKEGLPWALTEVQASQANFTESMWDCFHPEEEADDDFIQQSAFSILRMAIESIPKCLTAETRFALTTVDLNYQNIIVDSAGKISAMVDWDLVQTEAAVSGYARYPAWITTDWNPALRADDEHTDTQRLISYRQHYLQEMAKYALVDNGYDPRMTQLSHIVEAIAYALSMSSFRFEIVDKLLQHAFDNHPPFLHAEYAEDYEAGKTEEKDEMIKSAFATMWHTEWEETPMNDSSIRELEEVESVVTVIPADDVSERSSAMSTDPARSESSSSEPGTPETESFELKDDAEDVPVAAPAQHL